MEASRVGARGRNEITLYRHPTGVEGNAAGGPTRNRPLKESIAHARQQFDTVSAQNKELLALAQKVAIETAEPIKQSVTKAFNRVV